MAEVQKVKVLTFGDKTYQVDEMSDAVKSLVHYYNKANQDAADLHENLVIMNAARESLSREISNQVAREEAASAEKAKSSGELAVPPAAND